MTQVHIQYQSIQAVHVLNKHFHETERVCFCRGEKPWRPAPGQQASLQLFVTMFQEEVKIYREVSGASLHRRGYRGVVHRAALNESAAAGLLYMSGWPEIAAQGTKTPCHS